MKIQTKHWWSTNLLISTKRGPSWSSSCGSWIYNYLCNQCLSLLMLWVWISIRARCTALCDEVCQWLTTGRWFSLGTPVSSTNKTKHQGILNWNIVENGVKHHTTNQTNQPSTKRTHPSHLKHWNTKKTRTHDDRNPGPSSGQTQDINVAW